MDERIQRLNGIAQQGDIDAFYNIFREDVKLLEHIDEFPFVDTPLHISASAGHFLFFCEMMMLQPSFVNKRNPDGYTPIYLALLNGHIEIVHQLLQHDANLVYVAGREGMTPLHYAATTNDLALLDNFLSVCPNSIKYVTIRNETALHIALKYDKLEAFKFLVGWLLRNSSCLRKILGQKDVEGNTVLHIAVFRNQTQAVSHLLDWWGGKFLNIINKKNLEGKTALDILEGQRSQGVDNIEMRVILESAGALTASSLPTVTSYANYLRLPRICEATKIIFNENRLMRSMSDGNRNAMLVVAALLVTVSYQAAITPPGGLWQDDLFKPNTTDVLPRRPDDLYKLNITAPHRAGSAIDLGTGRFGMFMVFNSVILYSSLGTMVVLVPPEEPVGFTLAVFSVFLVLSYSCSIGTITNASAIWVFFIPIIYSTALVVISIALIGSDYLASLIRKEKLKKKYSRA